MDGGGDAISMGATVTSIAAERTLALPKVMDLHAASSLATELLALRGLPVAIDASAVEKAGAQCLQVLLSARLTWAQDGLAIFLSNSSSAFHESLSLAGLSVADIADQETSL